MREESRKVRQKIIAFIAINLAFAALKDFGI